MSVKIRTIVNASYSRVAYLNLLIPGAVTGHFSGCVLQSGVGSQPLALGFFMQGSSHLESFGLIVQSTGH